MRILRTLIVVVLHGALLVTPTFAVKEELFNQAFEDLDDNQFIARQRAERKFRRWSLAGTLTAAQAGKVRELITTGNIELQRRAQSVIGYYEKVQDLGTAIRDNSQVVENPKDAPGPGANYQLDGLYASTDLKKPPFTDLKTLSEAVRNSLQGGVDQLLHNRLQMLRDRVAGLTAAELTALNLDQSIKSDLVMKLDESLQQIPVLVEDAEIKMPGGEPLPKKIIVPAGGGALDAGLTFGLATTAPAAPGTIELFSPSDYSSALSDPPPGYRFVGTLFDLLAGSSLDLTGSSVTVQIEFERSSTLGAGIDSSLPVHLVRLANGEMDILNTTTDPSVYILSGSYSPESMGLEGDQLGEFALVQPIPEPATLLLCLAPLFVAGTRRRR